MINTCTHEKKFTRILSATINVEITQVSCSDCGIDIGTPKTEVG